VRADRLIHLVLLLQARGRMTARDLARELEISVRTVYRDLEALSAAGVPVLAESGPGGGCQLIDGYRFALRGLRPAEAEALLILGVPAALRDLGLDSAAGAALRHIRVASGLPDRPEDDQALVHLDMPRWFHRGEDVPHLQTLAEAVRQRRCVALEHQPASSRPAASRPGADGQAGRHARPPVVHPLGLVNKAGTWYLVASRDGRDAPAVFRVSRVSSARLLDQPVRRPAGFELAGFWERWSVDFAASRPRLAVRVRAAPAALALLPEVFGDSVHDALAAAGPPDRAGWQAVTLSFDHTLAAAHRLAGFGGLIEVLSPASVREQLLVTAREILSRYAPAAGQTAATD
jgi:predicted DNA-binding transcriptional regulator YafY